MVLALGVLSGCSGSPGPAPTSPAPATAGPATSPAAPSTAPPPAGTDWFTYHRDPGRSGVAPGVPPLADLKLSWRAPLDGAVYGQPLVVGDQVLAATENNTVYALDRGSGRVRWHTHLGPPVRRADLECGNIDPLGITGTPVYDPATRRVYAVAETTGFRHVLYGVAVADGSVQVSREVPTPDGQPRFDQQRAALLLANGRVYVAFGGLNGDCGPYVGSVVGVPVSGQGRLVSYRVPTSREGGIWATGGPTLGPDGRIYVSVGNGAAASGAYDGSDSVVALDAELRRRSVFAPSTWPDDNARDLDLGSMSPAVLPGNRVLIAGKSGTGYLLRTPDLGGVGGQLAEAPVCTAHGAPAHDGTTVYLPCREKGGGPAAVSVTGDRIQVRWRGPEGANGSPVLGGGAVWVASWTDGTLYALDPGTGRPRRTVNVGEELPHFVSPTLSGALVLLGTVHGVVAVSGA
jgi:outer membrane protein assembly factor BamB